MEAFSEVRKFLKNKASKKAKTSWRRYVKTSERVYGVYLADINKIVLKYRSGGFNLVKRLWKSGYLEECILASKLLGKICKRDPELTLKLVSKFVNDIKNWAVCDTLATQGIRPIAKAKQKEIFGLSKKLIKQKNPWKRRFALVLLTNFKNEKRLREEIKAVLKYVKNDKEYYVKKAVKWLERSFKL